MTRLVVSVRNSNEANIAANCGVDLIDLKEPSLGSLGPVSKNIACEVSNSLVDCPQPLSLAIGELADINPAEDFSYVNGFQFVKAGLSRLANENWQSKLKKLQESLPPGAELASVYYADRIHCGSPEFNDIFHFSFLHDLPAILLDTFDKTRGNLFDYLTVNQVEEMILKCHCAGLKLVVAGSITGRHFDRIESLNPDYIAVRGAICSGDRTGRLDRTLLDQFVLKLKNSSTNIENNKIVARALAY